MLSRVISILSLVILFGISQQIAITHEISHYNEISSSSETPAKSSHQTVCEKCLAFSGLDSAGAIQGFTRPTLAGHFDIYFYQNNPHLSFLSSVYLIRGPPLIS